MQADMEILGKNEKMLQIKNIVTQIKSAFDLLISGLNMVEEKFSEHENISINLKSKQVEENKHWKRRPKYSKTMGQPQKVQHKCKGDTKSTRKKVTREIFEKIYDR